jgi:hypothetical protein
MKGETRNSGKMITKKPSGKTLLRTPVCRQEKFNMALKE